MEINDILKPRPLNPYITETEESKRFHEVSKALMRVGIYGEENTIETCNALGIKSYCDCREGDKNESYS